MGRGVTDAVDGGLYLGEVVHKRSRPKRHSLRYRVFSLLVDLDQLDVLDRRLRLFSVGRFNVISLAPKEFGPHDGSSLAAFIRRKAAAAGFGRPVARIRMLCYPRFMGFAFNPITVYYLDDAAGVTRMLVYEVHNTFGESHFYEALVGAGGGPVIEHSLGKAFYVSPFNTLNGSYRFAVRPPAEAVFTGITLSDVEGGLVTAYFSGKRQDLTDSALLNVALAYPFMTAKVVLGIYWEALLLWLKGVPLTLKLRHKEAAPHATPR